MSVSDYDRWFISTDLLDDQNDLSTDGLYGGFRDVLYL